MILDDQRMTKKITTAKNLPPKLLFCTLLLGLLSALAFIEWSWYRGHYHHHHHSFTNTNKLYQTETSRLSLFPIEFNRDSIDRVSLGITLVFHGMFTISHCIHLIALQKIKDITLFPHFFLKGVLFLSFLRLGSFIGFIGFIVTLDERNKEGNDATMSEDVVRMLMGRIAWWSSALIWMQLAYAYGVLVVVAHQRRRQRFSSLSWRSLMFIFGDYRMIPIFGYGSAGLCSIIALLFVDKMGHWCEPALLGCLLGDVAGLHQVWLLLGGGNVDNESDGGRRGGQVKNE